MGLGIPTRQTFYPRQIGSGRNIAYNQKQGEIAADVLKGQPGTNTAASFQTRAPLHPPGTKGIGEAGSFVDARV